MPGKEDAIQMQIVCFLSEHQRKGNYIFFSVPNEGVLKAAGANRAKTWFFAIITKLKKMGMLPGVSDLVIVKNGRTFFLELKAPGKKLSKNQIIFLNNAGKVGAATGWADSYNLAVMILKYWGIVCQD